MKPKELRKALRNVVQELLPDLIKEELYTTLRQESRSELEKIHKMVQDSLKRMDERAKDLNSYIIRQVNQATVPNKKDDSE